MITAEQICQGLSLATAAAQAAELDDRIPKGPCGFAWVEVTVGRTNDPQAREFIKAGFRKDHKPRTLVYWNPSGLGTQSVDVKYKGAEAFAKYLRELGHAESWAWDRLD
jgi:hypothetical protein